jgi:putative sigma-54 modulation protein
MMKIATRSHGFSLTPALAAYTQKQVHSALAHRAEALRGVEVRLEDINGPRGGVDKECRVTARLQGGRTVTVQRRHEDLYLAVRDAAEVAGRRCDEYVGRRRAERREGAR